MRRLQRTFLFRLLQVQVRDMNQERPTLKLSERSRDYKNRIEHWKNDFPAFCWDMLQIRTQNGIIRLRLNPVQNRVWAEMVKAVNAGKKPRFIILKARQVGMTTLAMAITYWRTSLWEGRTALLVGEDDDSVGDLFEMAHLYYAQSSRAYRPNLKHANKKEIKFNDPDGRGLNSVIKIESGRKVHAGRSKTISTAHLTEMSLYPHPEDTLSSLKPGLTEDAWVIEEFTAQGVSHYSYKAWQEATEGRTDRIPIFIPWFEEERYSVGLPEDQAAQLAETFTLEERNIVSLHGLNPSQIAWRRWTIRNDFDGDTDKFRQ